MREAVTISAGQRGASAPENAHAAAHAAARATAHAAAHAAAAAWRRRTLESGATWQRQHRNTDNC